jgi:hypothetical protein
MGVRMVDDERCVGGKVTKLFSVENLALKYDGKIDTLCLHRADKCACLQHSLFFQEISLTRPKSVGLMSRNTRMGAFRCRQNFVGKCNWPMHRTRRTTS